METVMLGKYQLHHGEENCISGTRGSGAIFFCGCDLQCVFCQNAPISRHGKGEQISIERLADIFRELEDKGAHNINIVTGDKWASRICHAFDLYRPKLPVVWNCGGYEDAATLKLIEDYVDVYLPDFKFADAGMASEFCRRPDYAEVAVSAIKEMLRQKGNPVFDENGMITRGVIIRHLVIPLHIKNTAKVLGIIKKNFPDAWISFMLQYTPVVHSDEHPELNRILTERECTKALKLLEESGIENGYVQDISAATDELIPKF